MCSSGTHELHTYGNICNDTTSKNFFPTNINATARSVIHLKYEKAELLQKLGYRKRCLGFDVANLQKLKVVATGGRDLDSSVCHDATRLMTAVAETGAQLNDAVNAAAVENNRP